MTELEEKLRKLVELNTSEYRKALVENKTLIDKNKALEAVLRMATEDLADSRNCGTCLYFNDMNALCGECMNGSNYKWRELDRAQKLLEDD